MGPFLRLAHAAAADTVEHPVLAAVEGMAVHEAGVAQAAATLDVAADALDVLGVAVALAHQGVADRGADEATLCDEPIGL